MSPYEIVAISISSFAFIFGVPGGIYALVSVIKERLNFNVYIKYIYKDENLGHKFKFTIINKSKEPFSIIKVSILDENEEHQMQKLEQIFPTGGLYDLVDYEDIFIGGNNIVSAYLYIDGDQFFQTEKLKVKIITNRKDTIKNVKITNLNQNVQ